MYRFILYNFCVVLVTTLVFFLEVEAQEVELNISASEIRPHSVRLEINTNIPVPVEVMVSVSLVGQKPTDTWIGSDARARLEKSRTIYILDTSKAKLPAGDYYAEVSFYKRWGASKGNPAASNIPDTEATTTVKLHGTGASASDVIRKNELQKWVIETVYMGYPWDLKKFKKRLGNFDLLRAEMNHHSAYYFVDADMTLLVNNLLGTVLIWRMGQATR